MHAFIKVKIECIVGRGPLYSEQYLPGGKYYNTGSFYEISTVMSGKMH
jgi:hypothetical protein